MKEFDWLAVVAAMCIAGVLTLTGFTFGLLSRNLVDCCRKPDCCQPCIKPCSSDSSPCCPNGGGKKCPNDGTTEDK